MNNKCIVCETDEAAYYVKGNPKYCYCKECALEAFSDLGLLEHIPPKQAAAASEDQEPES